MSEEEAAELEQNEEFAKSLGVELSDIELIRENPEEFQSWRNSVSRNAGKPEFPVRTPSDPERRKDRVVATVKSAPRKTYEPKQRSVRTSTPAEDPKTWLRHQYTNDDDQMICQIANTKCRFVTAMGIPFVNESS